VLRLILVGVLTHWRFLNRESKKGSLKPRETTHIALFSTSTSESPSNSQSASRGQHSEEPPVDDGDLIDVEIDSLGD
jgi:hypothetical protein